MDPRALDFIISNTQRWIAAQRERFRPVSQPLSATESAALVGSFQQRTCQSVGIVWVQEIENPDFYAELGSIPLDFRTMAGITYGDTILLSARQVPNPAPLGLLFHEVVHVVQYETLGIDEFAYRYVMGWAQNGFQYRQIPLEVQAYRLQSEFEGNSLANVDVESLIRGALNS